MTRSFFLAGAGIVALTFTSLRLVGLRRVPRLACGNAGRCADRRRRLRWPVPSAADFV